MRTLLITAVAWTALSACGPSDVERADEQDARIDAALADAEDAIEQSRRLRGADEPEVGWVTGEEAGRACRGAIAGIMGRDPNIIGVIDQTDELVTVRYTRDDGTVWTQQCQVTEGRVLWRQVENGRPGRWRTEDGIRYTLLDGDQMRVVTTMDGEPMSDDTFEVSR